jgi:hypothetical protein
LRPIGHWQSWLMSRRMTSKRSRAGLRHWNFGHRLNGRGCGYPVWLFPSLKGISAQAIHDDLIAPLGNEHVAYSMLTESLRTAQSNTTKVL